MASSSAGGAHVAHSRQPSRPVVVPVIPLPYLQQRRTKQNHIPAHTTADASLESQTKAPKTAIRSMVEPSQNGQPSETAQPPATQAASPQESAAFVTTADAGPQSQTRQHHHDKGATSPRPASRPDPSQYGFLSDANPELPLQRASNGLNLPLLQPLPQYPHSHQVHPSNGSLVFGAIDDSSNASPASLSGPAYPPSDPTSAAPAPWQACSTAPDTDGRGWPVHHFPPPSRINGYNGLPPSFVPSSPHSVPSSDHARQQSPLANDHAPPPGLHTGASHDFQSFGAQPMFPDAAILHQLVATVSRGWNDPDSADCVIDFHIRQPSGSHLPSDRGVSQNSDHLQLYGHRLLLSQSARLQQLFQMGANQDRGVARMNQWFVDKYLTPESLGVALRTLYGIPPPPMPAFRRDSGAESYMLDKSLALAAAGQALELPFLRDAAIQEARRFLNWGNLDKVADFCLTRAERLYPASVSGLERGTFTDRELCAETYFTYGPLVRLLLFDVARFITEYCPTDFVLDDTVSDPPYARIPPPGLNNATAIVTDDAPQRGKNVSLHARSGSQVPMHSDVRNIRFGDLALTSDDDPNPSGVIDTDRPGSPGARTLTLSRLLLNLPFEVVRLVLGHPELGATSGEAHETFRRDLIAQVVAAREHRRHATLAALQTRGGHEAQEVLQRLGQRESPGSADLWDGLCWQESILADNMDMPVLVREWVPLAASAKSVD